MAEASRDQTARRCSASEQVADDLRAFVQREGLQPGDRLGREEDLARAFGVSRPTLREALRLLSSAHLVRASKGPGGGIFVAATPEQGIALSVSDSVASMLATDAVGLDELLSGAFMAWVVDVLQPSLQEHLRPAVVESTLLGQHQDVLAAIERGDAEAAERAMREHLIYLRDLLSVVDEFGDGARESE